MKNKEKAKCIALYVLLPDLIVLLVAMGFILYSLTYVAVPVEAAHEWYGRDLRTYLIAVHAFTLAFALLIDAIWTTVVTLTINGGF